MKTTKRWVLTSWVAFGLLAASPAALANWLWCCENNQHAGIDAQGRCINNQMMFANKDKCMAYKREHDKKTSHTSKCVNR